MISLFYQYFRKNKHPPKPEEQLQGVDVVNKHRDSQPDTAEERSRFNEIQLEASTV
ncbi:hypothetical protein FQN60_002143 [Etheostoma spectabile]|uniref:Uncharacterized protein n=1 Tax=Etheostoma spectabile TaxID=54343 RepID=A0A5J5DD38_9PERO|nr:hypothetical protein FQN60_002143 [Etheostoma spectabile]